MKWLRKITSTKEVLRHVTEARNLASLSSAQALFSLFTEKVPQNSSFPHVLKSMDSNIQHRKALIFYSVRWMCLKSEQNTFQHTLLTVSLLYNISASLSCVRYLYSWDRNMGNFHIFCFDKTGPSTSVGSVQFLSLLRTQNMLFQIILFKKNLDV